MLLAICVSLVAIVLLVVVIPGDVWNLLFENCLDHRGRVKPRYVWREGLAVGHFLAGFLLVGVVFASIIVVMVLVVDQHVIPLGLARQAIEQADIDPDVWEERLRQGSNSVSIGYENWYRSQGGSPEEARESRRFVWELVPAVFVIGLISMVVASRLTSIGFGLSLDQLVEEATLRNRRRIAHHYLQSTAQQGNDWQHKGDIGQAD